MPSREGATAFVTGVGGPAGRAVLDYLREHGIPAIGADMRSIEAGPGFLTLPAAADPSFGDALIQAVRNERVGLLVPTVTEELPLVAEMRKALGQERCSVFISPPDAVRVANDKLLTFLVLRRRGVAVPDSACGLSRQDLLATLPLPMLSKPRCGRGGREVEVHDHESTIPRFVPADRIFQVFLDGEEYDVNLFAARGGLPRRLVVLRKTALRDGRVGNAAGVERVEAPDVAALAEATSLALGLEGPIDMDIRRDRAGRPRVLEVNARVGANVRSAEEVLQELLLTWKEAR